MKTDEFGVRGARATNYNAVRPVVTLKTKKEAEKNESRLPHVYFLC